jgi:hypothetical protein
VELKGGVDATRRRREKKWRRGTIAAMERTANRRDVRVSLHNSVKSITLEVRSPQS